MKQKIRSQEQPDITFFLARLGSGGIGKMRLHLIEALSKKGYRVDLVLGDLSGPYVKRLKNFAHVYPLPTSHPWLGVPWFARYLSRRRPRAVVCEKLRTNVVAHQAKRWSKGHCDVFASVHGVLSHKLDREGLSRRKAEKKYHLIARWYPQNKGFIAVSRGIAQDLYERFRIPLEKIHVVPNPVLTPRTFELADDPPEHPWFLQHEKPVFLSVGRLERQKGFPVLLEAFARVRSVQPSRLVILGEGSQRPLLEKMIRELDLGDAVLLPGFVDNPYPFMRHADAFVLASLWEGFGNVLVEAMAFGTPVVATDCPAGPREILEDGRLGPLVPVNDVQALADAMLHVLRVPPPREPLIRASRRYTADKAAEGYVKALGLD